MHIKNLSFAQTFGTVLASIPDAVPHIDRCCVRNGEPIKEWLAQEEVILDYVSGMSLLVVYEAEETKFFYLDRIFKLCRGIRFSITALDDFCCVDCHTVSVDALNLLTEHPAEYFRGTSSELKLEHLFTFFYQECCRDFYFRGEQHEALELVYVDHGELHNLLGGTDILLRQQQLLLIDRNVWHMQYADLPVNFLTVSFRADAASPCSRLAGRCLELSSQQVALIRQMLAEDATAEYAYDNIESLLRLLLIDLLRHEQTFPQKVAHSLPATNYAEQRIVDQLVQTVSANAGQKLSLQQLANSAHVSTTYLHRIFKTQLGMTPWHYLTKIKIQECKLLIREGKLSMSEIANQLGFSSQQHFSRQFRTVTGMTPSEYSKSLR